jgi:hypothetical protein
MPNDFYASESADQYQRRQYERLTGPFPAPDFSASEASPDGRGARYDVFGCTVEYEYHSGLVQAPVAQAPSADVPKPAAVFGRRHAPSGTKTVTYYGRRTGAWPRLPAPDTSDKNLVLLSARTVPEVPVLDVSGRLYVYAAHVVYVYGLVVPVTSADGFAVGAAPFARATPEDNFLSPGVFDPGLA